MKRTISTTEAPDSVGAYSQATTDCSLVFTAGQIPLTPDGELLDCEPIATQAEQSLSNIEAVLASEGGGDERRVESDRLFR
jgi:2-iminobutanoate/2-iminopropanoate deaminase